MNEILNAVNKALSVPIKIYYNTFSGEIVGSCPQDHEIDTVAKMQINNPSVIVTRTIADKILENTSQYMVVFDKDTNTILPTKKSEVIKLLKPESKLFEIKKVDNITENENTDITITIYKDDLILTLSLNPVIINRSSMPLLISQLQFEEGSALNLFITKKNNPNVMLKSLYVNLNDFLSKSKNIKTLEYDISDILQNASIDEISIYTRRIFERYAWQIKDKFVSTHKIKGISKRLLEELETENCHLVIIAESPNVMTVELVIIPEIDETRILVALLGKKNNPYSLRKSIYIDLTELKNIKRFTRKTNYYIDEIVDITWPNKKINIKFIPYASPYN